MAKLNTSTITITISCVERESDAPRQLVTEDLIDQLEVIITELVGGPAVLVEINQE